MAPAAQRSTSKPTEETLPASQFLQARLQERRTRSGKSRQSDVGPQTNFGRDDDIFITEGDSRHPVAKAAKRYDSSPVAATKHATPDHNNTHKRAPGVRQLDEQIDRLNKENFDLKLELDHRRAREKKLASEIEAMRESYHRAEDLQAERAKILEAEHAELYRLNSELVEELEKRDKAIQEAVNIIYELEEKVEELEDDRHSVTRLSTVHADSGYAGTETQEAAPIASPADTAVVKGTPKALSTAAAAAAASRDLNEVLSDDSPAKAKRQPLFLSQAKPTTHALRLVYLESTKQLQPVKSFQSILSKHTSTIDDDDSGSLLSPRLSNLSEISFPTLYSAKKVSPDRNAWEPEDEASPKEALRKEVSLKAASLKPPPHGQHHRQDSISRVSQWIEGHNSVTETPLRSTKASAGGSVGSSSPATTTVPAHDGKQLSLKDALASPLFEPLDLLHQDLPFRPHTVNPSDSRRSSRTPTSFGGPIFGEPLLSPCPDSASHRLLKSSRSTIVGEKSVNDGSSPYFRERDHDLTARTAPKQMRSSVELKTAYANNLEYRKTGLSIVYADEDAVSSEDDDHFVPFSYNGYPDGGSILGGTPSRFLKQAKPPADSKETPAPTPQQKARRRSSSAAAVGAATPKPLLARSGTSPAIPLSLTTDMPAKAPRPGLVTSPLSFQSTSSSNRTAYGRPASPEVLSPPRQSRSRGVSRVSASPARSSLTQKTHQLLRRLSSSHGSERERERDRDVRDGNLSTSPSRATLPTLTSTPSSAYVNVIPKELRRANGSHSVDIPRSSETQIPPLIRTTSEVRTTTPATDSAVEKRGFFGRRGSFKTMAGLDRSNTTSGGGGRRRRSSNKDSAATPTRRLWI